MAHVAATTNRLPPMSAHIWHPQPHQHQDPSPKDQSSRIDLPVNPSVSSSTDPQTSLWHIRSSSPTLSDHVPSTLPTPPMPPRSSPVAPTPEVDLTDADAVFRNLLNLHIDGNPTLSRPLPAHSAPFRTAQSVHPSAVPPRLASPLTQDFPPDLSTHPGLPSRSLHPSTAQASPSVLMSLQGIPLNAHSPPYHPSTAGTGAGAHEGQAPSRVLQGLRHASVTPGSHVAGPVTASPMPPPPTSGTPRIKNELYKTEICRSFAENGGFCKYGAKCQFAHGEAELRPVRRHPRYKTKLCRNFVTTGSCPYDARCRFIHASDLAFVQNGASASLSVGNSGALVPGNPSGSNLHATTPFLQQLQQQHQLRQQQMLGSEAMHALNMRDPYIENMRPFAPLPASTGLHRLDNFSDALKAELRSAQSSADVPLDKPYHHAMQPMDQVYHANASGLPDFADNSSFPNNFMHLSNVASALRFPSTDLSDPERDPVLTTQHIPSSTVNVIGVGAQKDASASPHVSSVGSSNESLFAHQPSAGNKVSASPSVTAVPTSAPAGDPVPVPEPLPNLGLPSNSAVDARSDHGKGPMGTIARGDIENDNPAANRYTLNDNHGGSLFSHPPSGKHSLSPSHSEAPGTVHTHADDATELREVSSHAGAGTSPAPRSRLPVFLNMASDVDDA